MEITVQTNYKYIAQLEEAEVDILTKLLDRLPSNGFILTHQESLVTNRFVFLSRQACPDE